MNKLVVGLVAATVAVAVVIWLLIPDALEDGQANATAPALAGVTKADLSRLEARVAALEREVGELRGARERRRAGPGERVAGDRPSETGAGTPGDKPDNGAPLAAVIDENDPEVREKVQSIVRDELDIAEEERWQERVKVMRERMKSHVGEFAEEANLSQTQEEEITSLLTDEREKIMEAFREGRRTFDFNGARQRAMDMRTATDKKAEEILDEDQIKVYQERRAEEAERFSRGRWGGDRGNSRGSRGNNQGAQR